MELTSGMMSRGVYLGAISGAVEFPRTAGVEEILVAYGFGCECPDEQLYQDVSMPLDRLPPYIAEAEAAHFYRVGKDNLNVKGPAGRVEFMFRHESDIHFISEDATLIERLKAEWNVKGHPKILARLGNEWRLAGGESGLA